MQKGLFLAVIALVAGFCLGVIGGISYFTPVNALPNSTTPVTPAVSSPSPASDIGAQSDPVQSAPASVPAENIRLLGQASRVVTALRDKDYQTLSQLIHPTQGIVFTPYSTVDINANLRFAAAQISQLENDTTKYLWGISDSTGTPIEMTMQEYFARFVYNADYAQAPVIGIDQIIGSGNALENVSGVFPEARFVEYYFPALDESSMGFDWCSLKLVFTLDKDEYYLIAAIHSEWTI